MYARIVFKSFRFLWLWLKSLKNWIFMFQRMHIMIFSEVLKISYFDQKYQTILIRSIKQTIKRISLKKNCSENFLKIQRKASVLESLFNIQNSVERTCTGVSFWLLFYRTPRGNWRRKFLTYYFFSLKLYKCNMRRFL